MRPWRPAAGSAPFAAATLRRRDQALHAPVIIGVHHGGMPEAQARVSTLE
jgi:hypothetical protein